MDIVQVIVNVLLLIMIAVLRVELWTAQIKIKRLEDRSNDGLQRAKTR